MTISSFRRGNGNRCFGILLIILLPLTTQGFVPVASSSSSPTATTTIPSTKKHSNNPSSVEDVVANSRFINILKRPVGSKDVRERILPAAAAGVAVALAMVPEAVAFSFVAGVSPLVGLWTTVILGFFAAAFGGRAGICSSASGACSVVVAALCRSHGSEYLSGCAILAGCIQAAIGAAGLGKFIRLVPHPVMLGFVNGLALVMAQAQLGTFKDTITGAFLNPMEAVGASTYGLTVLTMVIVRLIFPMLSKAITFVGKIPPTLGGVVLSSIIARILKLPVRTLADVAGADTFRGGLSVLPKLGWPKGIPIIDYFNVILPYAGIMAAVGCVESLLTMQLVDGIIDDGTRGSTRKECIGQGIGNIAAGLTGGIGGCALIGQSLINVESGGGASRISGMSMAMFLGLGIVCLAPLLGQVPVAALVGVMLLVCQSTFSWSSLRLIGRIPMLDAAIILLVSAVTVFEDLAKAVLIGTVVSALGFAWKQSTSIYASITSTTSNSDDSVTKEGDVAAESIRIYGIRGPLFFGSTTQFLSLFDPKNDPENIVIDFSDSRIMDHSGLVAVNELADRYGTLGKKVTLRGLSSDSAALLSRLHAGGLPPYEMIASNPLTDPLYEVAEDSKYYMNVPVPKPSV